MKSSKIKIRLKKKPQKVHSAVARRLLEESDAKSINKPSYREPALPSTKDEHIAKKLDTLKTRTIYYSKGTINGREVILESKNPPQRKAWPGKAGGGLPANHYGNLR